MLYILLVPTTSLRHLHEALSGERNTTWPENTMEKTSHMDGCRSMTLKNLDIALTLQMPHSKVVKSFYIIRVLSSNVFKI